jgi:hypothetical protein
MFSLFANSNLSALVKNETIPFVSSFILANYLYHFGSFGIECIAFLFTWFLFGKVQKIVKSI